MRYFTTWEKVNTCRFDFNSDRGMGKRPDLSRHCRAFISVIEDFQVIQMDFEVNVQRLTDCTL